MCDTDFVFERRQFIKLGAAAGAGVLLGGGALPAMALSAGTSARRKTLVWIYAGGGNDGLHMFPRIGDPKFATYRPDTITAPGSGPNAALKLGSETMFALNPNLEKLADIWSDNKLAISMATAVPESNGSHFYTEGKLFRGGQSTTNGLLARYLDMKNIADPMGAVRAGLPDVPGILQGGSTSALSVKSSVGFDIQATDWCSGTGCADNRLTQQMARLGAAAQLPAIGLNAKVRVTEKVIVDSIARVKKAAANYQPSTTITYSPTPIGNGLKTVAQLLKDNVPVEVAYVNWPGQFDRHSQLVESGGVKYDSTKPASQYLDYAKYLKFGAEDMATFYKDMSMATNSDIVVLVTTEFGRRIGLNGTAGTDHGFGGAWFMFGAGVKGGIYADPGPLADIVGSGVASTISLPMRMNYKNMVGEIMAKHMGIDQTGLATLFPGHSYSDPGMLSMAAA